MLRFWFFCFLVKSPKILLLKIEKRTVKTDNPFLVKIVSENIPFGIICFLFRSRQQIVQDQYR